MKHKFTITYETDGLPICPDAIHEQLDLAMRDIRDKFGKKYYMLPGLHKIYLEPCGDWFSEEQKPMRFELQASAKDSPIGKATSAKRVGPPIKNQASSVSPKGKINWFKKKMDRDQA